MAVYPHTEFDEAHEIDEEPRSIALSLHLMVKRNLPPDADKWPQEKIFNQLNRITHLRLDRENIKHIDNLELLGKNLTNVYLHQNCIENVENLESLQSLKFLTLAGNKIRHIKGLSQLHQMAFLDLSGNLIESFDIDELPQSLIILNLKGNPCTQIPDYRGRIIQDLPHLRQLDLLEVEREERLEAGYRLSSSEDEEDDTEDNSTDENPTDDLSAIDMIFQKTSADILLRSQSRLEECLKDHQQRLKLLDEMREQRDLPPRSARPSSSARATQATTKKA